MYENYSLGAASVEIYFVQLQQNQEKEKTTDLKCSRCVVING